jgi:hypothetical protein
VRPWAAGGPHLCPRRAVAGELELSSSLYFITSTSKVDEVPTKCTLQTEALLALFNQHTARPHQTTFDYEPARAPFPPHRQMR